MGRVLRVLWIAESDDDAPSITDALQSGGFQAAVRRVQTPAALLEALAGQSWDVVTCSVRGSLPPGALLALDSLPAAARPPLILIADRFECAALEAYRWTALVCLRDRLFLQLTAAVESLLADVEARAAERQSMQQSEARYRQIVDTAYEGVWLTDASARTLFVNRRTVELMGYTAEELLGRNLCEFIDPSSRVAARELWQRTQSASHQVEMLFRRQDGSQFSAIVAASAVRDEQGAPVGMLGMLTDISELRRAEQVLRQRQRIESLGTLAGGIAHDFNNILTTIAGNVALAVGDLPEEHPVQDSLAEIHVAAKRAADLVRQILTFSQKEESRRSALRVESLIEEALQLLRATSPSSVRIETRYAPNLPEIFADPTQLHQVLVNLGTNAVRAMGQQGGTLSVRAQGVTEQTRKLAGATELRAGRYVKLEVCDTGSGMDASTLERIFDPFFTTCEPGTGSGLGLSVVYGIIKSHEGAIEVQSRPGAGSRFSIYLPALTRVQADPPRPLRLEHARGEGERVLCLDDEAAVVRVATQVLRRLGYRPTGYTDAVQALEDFRTDPSAFDLLLTDFAMPQLTGHELVASFARVRPSLPIVVSSGRIDQKDMETLRAAGIREVLLKPSSVAELSAALRRALRDRR